MRQRVVRALLALCCGLLLAQLPATDAHTHLRKRVREGHAKKPLPVFFFHGVTSSEKAGGNFYANLTAEGRLVVPLTFCTNLCSVKALNGQVQAAIAQIRETIKTDARFQDGYVFIGHSQGAVIARAVIEEMDDHDVRMLISLAGPQTGVFYGPQATDMFPLMAFVNRIGPKMIPSTLFDFSKYSQLDFQTGKFQSDFNDLALGVPALQEQLSVMNLARSPVKDKWRRLNTFLPVLDNVQPCESDDRAAKSNCTCAKSRRRRNFLRLKSAHFFGSPADDVVAPWQSTVLGHYADVAKSEDILLNFKMFRVIDAKKTEMYTRDTYGLRTLDSRGGLFLYSVPNVGHSCWLVDYTSISGQACLFKPVYENYIYPLLHSTGWGVVH
ncbi:hypothetical protein ATCC90586_008603 [Pythium insidiosum]|nr:hypothetical protein ATCC90586_008603 [Pythium insidiosum]